MDPGHSGMTSVAVAERTVQMFHASCDSHHYSTQKRAFPVCRYCQWILQITCSVSDHF